MLSYARCQTVNNESVAWEKDTATLNQKLPMNLIRNQFMLSKEIEHMRKMMEHAVLSGLSFTSPQVVTISQQLDLKLVEYMKNKK